MSFPHRVAVNAECVRRFGRTKIPTKPFPPQAASRGHRMGSYSRIPTAHPVTKVLLLFFSYRLIRRRFADSLRHLRGGTSILNFRPMVKRWPSPVAGKRVLPFLSTRCQFLEEKSDLLFRVRHTSGV